MDGPPELELESKAPTRRNLVSTKPILTYNTAFVTYTTAFVLLLIPLALFLLLSPEGLLPQAPSPLVRLLHAANDTRSPASRDTELEVVMIPEHKPPFYFIVTSAFLKPMITMTVFGPPKPGTVDGYFKTCVQVGVFVMAIAQAYLDAKHAMTSFTLGDSWWEGFCFAMTIFSGSGNITSSASIIALITSTSVAEDWENSHTGKVHNSATMRQNVAREPGQLPELPRFANSIPRFFYGLFMVCTYIFMVGTLMLFCLPSLVLYIWAFVPLVAMMIALSEGVLKKNFPKFLAWVRGSNLMDPELVGMQQAVTVEERAKHLEVVKVRAAIDPSNIVQNHPAGFIDPEDEREHLEYVEVERNKLINKVYLECYESYKLTGILENQWGTFFLLGSVAPPIVMFFTPVAARLYTGEGYMPSLMRTCSERTMTSYVGYLTTSLGAKFKMLNLLL